MSTSFALPPPPPRENDGSPSFHAVDASPRLRPTAAAAVKAWSLPATVHEEAHEGDVSPLFLLDASPRVRANVINHLQPAPPPPSMLPQPPSSSAQLVPRGGVGTTRAWSLPATVHHGGAGRLLDDARTRSLLSAALFPAAATVTTDVLYQSALLSPSSSSSSRLALGYDVVLVLTNVSGAFLDGFFQAWETGVAVPVGAGTEALHVVACDFRAYYLSTYTSWAGMVGVAASLANARSSASIGAAYIVVSTLLAFVAHGG
jgi:hypothetical protein